MSDKPEPWLRGTLTGVAPVQRAILHALELACEDIHSWCGDLDDAELNARPHGVAPVAFHVRHIARSLDRLLTYAEGARLSDTQMAELRSELDDGATGSDVLAEFDLHLERAVNRIRALAVAQLDDSRAVGRRAFPTTVAGLLIHAAEHTQRHVGQAITTAKIVMAARSE